MAPFAPVKIYEALDLPSLFFAQIKSQKTAMTQLEE
jgi:hypothetical protein